MANEKVNQAVEAAVAEWLPRFILQRKALLRKKAMQQSGELINSIEGEIARQAAGDAVQALIAFNEKGRWLDMRPRRGIRIPQGTINKVAFGVKLRRAKRTKWWNKAKTAAIFELYNNIAAALPDATAETLLSQFPNK